MDQMDQMFTNGSGEEGNTKPPPHRVSPSKSWCFTWNNYPEDALDQLFTVFKGFEWIAGKEVGEQGTKHLQGYVTSDVKVRPIEKFKLCKEIHWEKCKGTKIQNLEYCAKEGDYVGTLKPPRPLKLISPDRPWQVDLLNRIKEEPDDRTILWLWEEIGNVGKSAMTKYLVAKHGALMCSGKAADMKYLVVKYHETHGIYPELIVFDIPRTNVDFLSYTGLEEVKNGCFASTKYECQMVCMNCPHMVCFANCEPDRSKVSMDRWNIIKIA